VGNLGGADRFLRSYLRAVAFKTAHCVHCGGCAADCPTGALVINGTVGLTDACVHCARCLGSIERGCLAAKSLQAGEGGSVKKGLDRYCTFGLRKGWLEQYFADPTSWWCSDKLGPKQFPAMRAWLKEAEVIDGTALTPLGEKLRSLGAGDPLTWAVIWANLARNSTVANWFIANVPWQSEYTKSQLVEQLGDACGRRTRENAVNALVQLLRETPLGSDMGLALPVTRTHGETTYAKAGWTNPTSVAILYTLYRLAGKQGRHAFALDELCNAADEGPCAVFGIESHRLTTILRGAASRWPEWVRVEFVRDLDSVYLDPGRTAIEVLSIDGRGGCAWCSTGCDGDDPPGTAGCVAFY
jgi:phosphoadenosine phosphosulfate reductase